MSRPTLKLSSRAVVLDLPPTVRRQCSLYDDDCLWVAPGSNARPASAAEEADLAATATLSPRHDGAQSRDGRVGTLPTNSGPIGDAVPVSLKAGDGVVYLNCILHVRNGPFARNSVVEQRLIFAFTTVGKQLHQPDQTAHAALRLPRDQQQRVDSNPDAEMEREAPPAAVAAARPALRPLVSTTACMRLLPAGLRSLTPVVLRCRLSLLREERETVKQALLAVGAREPEAFRTALHRLNPHDDEQTRLTAIALLRVHAAHAVRDDGNFDFMTQNGTFHRPIAPLEDEPLEIRKQVWSGFEALDA